MGYISEIDKPFQNEREEQAFREGGSYDRFPLEHIQHTLDLARETRKILPYVTEPVYVFHARKDPYVSRRSAKHILQHIGSSEKLSFIVPTKQHALLYADNPWLNREEFFERLYQFILRFS